MLWSGLWLFCLAGLLSGRPAGLSGHCRRATAQIHNALVPWQNALPLARTGLAQHALRPSHAPRHTRAVHGSSSPRLLTPRQRRVHHKPVLHSARDRSRLREEGQGLLLLQPQVHLGSQLRSSSNSVLLCKLSGLRRRAGGRLPFPAAALAGGRQVCGRLRGASAATSCSWS